MSTEYETRDHDVLVIGAGGAGLRAAIEASAHGVSVGLVCKSLLGKANTVMASAARVTGFRQQRSLRNTELGPGRCHPPTDG